jgi:predicted nucleic acid-binding protein
MILVDTSTIGAWLDSTHRDHQAASEALSQAMVQDEIAVSVVTIAELAAGGRTAEAIGEDLAGMRIIEVTGADAEWAGRVFARTPRKQRLPLPDFFIRAQVVERGWKHLTNDRRSLAWWPEVEFLFGNAG